MSGIIFHPLAERELVEAARFYEARAVGLGGDFIREVEHSLTQIAASPQAGRVFEGTIRRWLVRRFPFANLYRVTTEDVSVVALMHVRRRPGYWKRRARPKS